jgi:hypothetical protein
MRHEALWRRLDTPGHDAAEITETATGALLSGTAVFHENGHPARLSYEVRLTPGWSATSGHVTGFYGGERVDTSIERRADGWYLNDGFQGLSDLVDLDFGFTPATNMPQLRRFNLADGETADISVAWYDIGVDRLVVLPQIYRRIDARSYAYNSPAGDYRATLEVAPSGFAKVYPGLWVMESHGA